jgi:tetratricopeptide (TPR) repeat protein
MNNHWEQQKLLAEEAAALGNYDRAEVMWLAALEETERFNSNDPRLVATIKQLSTVALRRLNWPALQTKSPQPTQAALGELARKIIDLVDFYYSRKRYSKAEILCQRLLQIYEHEMGIDHPDVGTIMQNLAAIYKQMGLSSKAADCNRRAMEIRSAAIQIQSTSAKHQISNSAAAESIISCQVCHRPLPGSARPIIGQKCLRCTSVAMDSITLETSILTQN